MSVAKGSYDLRMSPIIPDKLRWLACETRLEQFSQSDVDIFGSVKLASRG